MIYHKERCYMKKLINFDSLKHNNDIKAKQAKPSDQEFPNKIKTLKKNEASEQVMCNSNESWVWDEGVCIIVYLPATVASKVKATRDFPGFALSGSSLSVSFLRLTSFRIVTAFWCSTYGAGWGIMGRHGYRPLIQSAWDGSKRCGWSKGADIGNAREGGGGGG